MINAEKVLERANELYRRAKVDKYGVDGTRAEIASDQVRCVLIALCAELNEQEANQASSPNP